LTVLSLAFPNDKNTLLYEVDGKTAKRERYAK